MLAEAIDEFFMSGAKHTVTPGKKVTFAPNAIVAAPPADLFPRHSHINTKQRVETMLARLGGNIKGNNTIANTHNESAKIDTAASASTTMTDKYLPPKPPASIAKHLTVLDKQQQMRLLDETFDAEDRKLLSKLKPSNTAAAAVAEAAAEADGMDEDLDATEELIQKHAPLVKPFWEDDENEDESSSETDLGSDDGSDGKSLDDESFGSQKKKKAKKTKSTAAPKTKANGATDDASGKGTPENAKKRTKKSKMSDAARAGAEQQKTQKRQRKEQLSDKQAAEQHRALLGDYIYVAANNLFQRVEAAGAPIERTFDQMVREDRSTNELITRLKNALTRIELESVQTVLTASNVMPEQIQVIRDFVADAELLRTLPESHLVDQQQCVVTRQNFPRERLVALEAVRTRADGTCKSVRLITHTKLQALIEAFWFLTNMMQICEQQVHERLIHMRKFCNNATTHAAALQLLLEDKTTKSATAYLFTQLRKALDKVDTSTKLLHELK